jgi:hypothetical protein
MRAHRLRDLAVIAAGLVLAVGPATVLAQAVPENPFGSYRLVTDASGIALSYAQGAGKEPIGGSVVPETHAIIETGPVGYARSSAAWPGTIPANVGNLAVLLGAPSELSAVSYPVRAEAFSPSGPARDDHLAPAMTARAEGTVVESAAHYEQFSSGDNGGAGSIETVSRGAIEGGLAVATAQSTLHDVSLAKVITIDSVTSFGRAATNGVDGTAEGSTVVSGLSIGGMPATIDEDGVHFGDQTNPNPANAVAQQIGEQVLSHAFIQMYLTEPVKVNEGGSVSFSSGSLVVLWNPDPSNSFVYSVGGVNVRSRAALADPDAGTTDPAPDPSGGPSDVSPSASSSDTPLPADPPVMADAAPLAAAALPASSAPEVFGVPIRYFDGLSPGLVLASFAGVALAVAGLRRVRIGAFDGPSDTCTLQQRRIT